MPKKIFNAENVVRLPGSVIMQPPKLSKELEEEVLRKQKERYTGPTADEQRAEAQKFKSTWQVERETIIAQARAHAEQIVDEAERRGDELIDSKIIEAETLQKETKENVAQLRESVEKEIEQSKENIEKEAAQRLEETQKKGYDEGFLKGLEEGKEESKLIIKQLHIILNKVIERRTDMLDELESQIINLILAISKKIVKALSEEQRSVVINNVTYALRKIRRATDVTIRVNLSDLKVITKSIKSITAIAENVEHVTVVEDTSIDSGGCVIETDFGEIDARISTQLETIERNIRQLMPFQTNDGGRA